MKKFNTNRLVALLAFLCLITSCFVGTTLAKYTSTATGSDTATVAKWSFKVEGTEIAVDPAATITFDLFDTINDTGNTADETDVKDALIAPGTAGSFELNLANTSEVNAKYTIALAETNASNVPLQYSLDGTAWVDSIAELTMTGLTDQAIAMESGIAAHTVYWRWVFEGTDVANGADATDDAHEAQTDAVDTALGIAARTTAPTVTITATVTATQVD